MIKLHSDTHFSEIIIFLYLFMSVNILTKIKKIWGGMPQHSTFYWWSMMRRFSPWIKWWIWIGDLLYFKLKNKKDGRQRLEVPISPRL